MSRSCWRGWICIGGPSPTRPWAVLPLPSRGHDHPAVTLAEVVTVHRLNLLDASHRGKACFDILLVDRARREVLIGHQVPRGVAHEGGGERRAGHQRVDEAA